MRLFGVVVEELEEVFVFSQQLSLSVHAGLQLGLQRLVGLSLQLLADEKEGEGDERKEEDSARESIN